MARSSSGGCGSGGSTSVGGSVVPSPDAVGRRGVLRRLRIEHFYEIAVTILGGRWALEGCEVASSRAPNRACAGVVLRNVSSVEVTRCTITGCSSAVLLSSAHARLIARATSFANARHVIEAIRGGHIDVQRCTFGTGANDVGMRIAADTAGVVRANSVNGGGTLWGRIEPPVAMQYAEQGDEDAHEELGGANGLAEAEHAILQMGA